MILSGVVASGQNVAASPPSVELTPLEWSFTRQTTIGTFDLMPAALQWVDEGFSSDTGQFTLGTEGGGPGTLTFTSGEGVITHTGGGAKSTLARIGADIAAPCVWVEMEVKSRTGTGLSYDNIGCGIIKDGTNFAIAQWDRVAQRFRLQIQVGGVNYFDSDVVFNPSLPFKMAFSLVGNFYAVWTDTGSGWTVQQRADIRTFPRTPAYNLITTSLTGWKAGISLATSGDATWNLDNLKAGRFGAVGLRDISIVTDEDGRAVDYSGKVRLSATCSDPSGAGYMGLFEFNPSTYALTQIGGIWISRDSGVWNDHAGHTVKLASGDYKFLISTWGNGFGSDLHIRYLETSTDLSTGFHVLTGTTSLKTLLPNVPNNTTTGGSYDPYIVKRGSDWLIAYAIVDPTSFAGENFYCALAETTNFSTFTGIGADTTETVNEGPRIVPINSDVYVITGGRGEQIVYDETFTEVGSSLTASPAFYNGTDTQPWMSAFSWDSEVILLTWDNTRFNSVLFTWGDVQVYTAPRY